MKMYKITLKQSQPLYFEYEIKAESAAEAIKKATDLLKQHKNDMKNGCKRIIGVNPTISTEEITFINSEEEHKEEKE